MEDLYGEYDDFWDAYSYPELNGGLEIDFSDWIDFWEDFWDAISDGWDDFWDWVDYQFEPEPDCWDPVQGGSLRRGRYSATGCMYGTVTGTGAMALTM